jgi:hypothetical protein
LGGEDPVLDLRHVVRNLRRSMIPVQKQ